jgi:phage gpG-like protein
MITIRSNVLLVTANLIKKMHAIADIQSILRPVAVDVLNMMTERIHEKGIAADGGQIGTYSPRYMKLRTGNYKNSSRYTRGTKAGKAKDAGLHLRGKNIGKARPRYNRTNDTKVIVSLTRQLENDWAIIGTAKGYAIGFNNPFNAKKMRWVEGIKKKKIAMLTAEERAYAIERFRKLANEKLNS